MDKIYKLCSFGIDGSMETPRLNAKLVDLLLASGINSLSTSSIELDAKEPEKRIRKVCFLLKIYFE